jgi:hypothetical protein
MQNPIKNVDYVVHTVIDELAGGDIADVLWFRRCAYRCISEELPVLSSFPTLRILEANVNSVGQVKLPPDYAKYTKIAVNIGGTLWTLGYNSKIALDGAPNACDPPSSDGDITTQDATFGLWFSPYSNGSAYYGTLYSVGGGFNDAYYRVDEAKGIIQFLNHVPRGGKLVMEYQSNLSDANENTLIPSLYIRVLRWYLIAKACEKFPDKYKMLFTNPMLEFEQAKSDAQIVSGPTKDEILDAVWSGSGFKLR